MTTIHRNHPTSMDGDERKKVIEQVFNQYDADGSGELSLVQVQVLHGDLRMGGISIPQVSYFFVAYSLELARLCRYLYHPANHG